MVAGCAPQVTTVRPPILPAATGWRALASEDDQLRIAEMPATWREARAAVTTRYFRLLVKEDELLDPVAARAMPTPPPGSYACRLVRLGRDPDGKAPPIQSFSQFFCYIKAEGDDRLSFTKQTGTELPGGWLYPDGARRLVMMGAQQRAPGDNSLPYAAERDRDLIGVVERIGPFRWRLVLPWRGSAPGLDVYELTPVPADKQATEPPAP